jgi:hypothetical protein
MKTALTSGLFRHNGVAICLTSVVSCAIENAGTSEDRAIF